VIDWIREAGSYQWIASNIQEVVAIGTDAVLKVIPEGILGKYLLSAEIGYSFLTMERDGTRAEAAYCVAQSATSSAEMQYKYGMNYLSHAAVLGAHHTVFRSLKQNWRLRLEKRENMDEVRPILDARTYMDYQNVTLFFEVTNLLNVEHADYAGVEQPGWWPRAGIVVNLGE